MVDHTEQVADELAFWRGAAPAGWVVYGWTFKDSCQYLEKSRRGSQTVSGDFMRAMAERFDTTRIAELEAQNKRLREALERIKAIGDVRKTLVDMSMKGFVPAPPDPFAKPDSVTIYEIASAALQEGRSGG